MPWGRSDVPAPFALPHNAATGRRYSGVNVLILWGAVVAREYSRQAWLTFRQAQAQALGCAVRRGERGVTVVHADRFTPEDERRRARESGDDPRAVAFLKRFTVFCVDRCDGLPADLATAPAPVAEG